MTIDELIDIVRRAGTQASYRGREAPPDSDGRDHLMQAHFRLTEALAHLRVAKRDLDTTAERSV